MINSIETTHIEKDTVVLLRSSLNLPISKDGQFLDLHRLNESLKTIEYLRNIGAKTIIISHFGRDGASLEPVSKILNNYVPVRFIDKLVGKEVDEAKQALNSGEILLLENTRVDKREVENDESLTKELLKSIDLFVFDDFSAAHRVHASTVSPIKYKKSLGGINFCKEIVALEGLIERVHGPSLTILAGAKPKTKIPLLKNLIKEYDFVFVGGVILNMILKEKGYNIGNSLVYNVPIDDSLLNNEKLIIPKDVIVKLQTGDKKNVAIEGVKNKDVIVDVGEKAICELFKKIKDFKTILWNGPLGLYEEGFTHQTLILSKLISKIDAYKVLGGGDTAGLIISAGQEGDWSHISTGGGSLLYYLSNKSLPAIDAFNS